MEMNKLAAIRCSFCGDKIKESASLNTGGNYFCNGVCFDKYKVVNPEEKNISHSKINDMLNLMRNEQHDYDYNIMCVNSKEKFDLSKQITKRIFEEENKLKFIITSQVVKKGKVVNKYYEYKRKVPLIRLGIKYDNKTLEYNKEIFMVNDVMDRWWKTTAEFYKDFFMYDFVCGDHQYILMSEEELQSEEYTITGMVVHIDNHNQVSKDCKLSQKMPLLFINKIESNKIEFKNHEECIAASKEIGLDKEKFMNYLFSSRGQSYRQPKWYENLICSFLFSAEYDYYRNYLLVIGEPETGKTRSSIAIYEKFGEPQAYTSGSNSTIRGLIPSFNSSPIKMGALINSVRLHFVDEFLRIINAKSDDEQSQRMLLGKLNSLYDGMQELFESGNGRAEGKMNCKVMAVSNPSYGCSNIELMMMHLDHAFLSRNIIYFQNKEHIDAIKSGSLLEKHTFDMKNRNFIAFYDYFMTFRSDYDSKIIDLIYKTQAPKQVYDSDGMIQHYKSRQLHHLHCIMDGYVKLRCLIDQDCSFSAKKEDYLVVSKIWYEIVNSWTNKQNIEMITERSLNNSLNIEFQGERV